MNSLVCSNDISAHLSPSTFSCLFKHFTNCYCPRMPSLRDAAETKVLRSMPSSSVLEIVKASLAQVRFRNRHPEGILSVSSLLDFLVPSFQKRYNSILIQLLQCTGPVQTNTNEVSTTVTSTSMTRPPCRTCTSLNRKTTSATLEASTLEQQL